MKAHDGIAFTESGFDEIKAMMDGLPQKHARQVAQFAVMRAARVFAKYVKKEAPKQHMVYMLDILNI